MFRHYLLTALRNAWRHRVTTAINIVGLAIGLTVFITAWGFLTLVKNGGRHFANSDRIHLVVHAEVGDGVIHPWPMRGCVRPYSSLIIPFACLGIVEPTICRLFYKRSRLCFGVEDLGDTVGLWVENLPLSGIRYRERQENFTIGARNGTGDCKVLIPRWGCGAKFVSHIICYDLGIL